MARKKKKSEDNLGTDNGLEEEKVLTVCEKIKEFYSK